MPRRPQRLQQSGLCMALQNSRWLALLHVKQSAWVPHGNNHAVDRHCWRMPQPKGLRTVDDRQHNKRRLDEIIKLQQDWQWPHPSIHLHQRGKKKVQVFLDTDMKGYSQWFVGKRNNVVDALLREWQRTNKNLTSILRSPSSHIRCQTISRYYQYPARSVAGWSHCCINCPWASSYGRNTQRQSLSMATLDNILQVR